jgi:hypothetical protein
MVIGSGCLFFSHCALWMDPQEHQVYSLCPSKLGTVQRYEVVLHLSLDPVCHGSPCFHQSVLSLQQPCINDLLAAISSWHCTSISLAPSSVGHPNQVRTMGTPHIPDERNRQLSRTPGNRELSIVGLPSN